MSRTAGPRLWRDPEPWENRAEEKGGGPLQSRLLAVAKGTRPSSKRLEEFERQATLLGALFALNAADAGAWGRLDLSEPPLLTGDREETTKHLLRLARQGAGRSFSSLPRAAEYHRQAVIAAGLEEPAWYARALHLSIAAGANQEKRGQVESGVATGLGVATKVAASSLIGLVAVPFLAGGSALASGMSSRSKVVAAEADRFATAAAQSFQQSIERHRGQRQARIAQQQLRQLQTLERFSRYQAIKTAEIEAQRITKAVEIGAWTALIAGTGLIVYSFVPRRVP